MKYLESIIRQEPEMFLEHTLVWIIQMNLRLQSKAKYLSQTKITIHCIILDSMQMQSFKMNILKVMKTIFTFDQKLVLIK